MPVTSHVKFIMNANQTVRGREMYVCGLTYVCSHCIITMVDSINYILEQRSLFLVSL